MIKIKKFSLSLLITILGITFGMIGCQQNGTDDQEMASADQTVNVAFVTNNASDFWSIAKAGVTKAEEEFNANCDFQMPAEGTPADQQRIVEALIARGVSGMAISPNDAENQIDMINMACEHMNVITHDSDAPKSNRLCYVGTNNYIAGREAGKLIKEVLPEGGKIMLFVGRLDAQNAKERRTGIIDELLGVEQGESNIAEQTGEIQAGNITIINTLTDLTDRARAKQNVEDTLIKYPDIDCLVGLWSYNGPAILSAVKDNNKAGQIPVICFDEETETLQGVQDAHIYATVVQQPYLFGYESVRILAALARGDQSVLPENGILDIPVKIIKQDNVNEFWKNLKRLKSGATD